MRRILLSAIIALATLPAQAQPFPRESLANVEQGKSAPYVGAWAISMPGGPTYATCDKPIHFEAADETHIFYIGTDGAEPDAAIELVPDGRRTNWEPIAGGPRSLTLWIDQNTFHLYDAEVVSDEEWTQPLVYRRCP